METTSYLQIVILLVVAMFAGKYWYPMLLDVLKNHLVIRNGNYQNMNNWVDVSFLLLLSCIFSFLTIDALFLLSPDSWITNYTVLGFFIGLIISLIISVSLLVCWMKENQEQGVGAWAMIIFLLQIAKPDGIIYNPDYLYKTNTSVECNISLIIFLFFISTSVWIYYQGTPFDSSKSSLRKRISLGGLLALILLGSISLGSQIQKSIVESINAPSIRFDSLPNIYTKLLHNSDSEVMASTYKMMSEIQLSEYYRKNLSEVERDLTRNYQNDHLSNSIIDGIKDALKLIKETGDYSESNVLFVFRRIMQDQDLYYDNNDVSMIIQRIRGSDNPYMDLAVIQRTKSISGEDLNFIKQRCDTLFELYKKLPFDTKIEFVKNRINWVQFSPLSINEKPRINLISNSLQERFNEISIYRQYATLDMKPGLKKELFKEFGDEYTDVLRDIESFNSNQYKIGSNRHFTEESIQHAKSMFPPLGKKPSDRDLHEQLCLPTAYESYLAIKEYDDLREIFFRNELKLHGMESYYEEISDAWNKISQESKNALWTILLDKKNSERNLSALVSLARTLDTYSTQWLKDYTLSNSGTIRNLRKIISGMDSLNILSFSISPDSNSVERLASHDSTLTSPVQQYQVISSIPIVLPDSNISNPLPPRISSLYDFAIPLIKFSKEEKEKLEALLGYQDNEVEVKDLFDEHVLSFVRYSDLVSRMSQDTNFLLWKEFLQQEHQPIAYVLQEILKRDTLESQNVILQKILTNSLEFDSEFRNDVVFFLYNKLFKNYRNFPLNFLGLGLGFHIWDASLYKFWMGLFFSSLLGLVIIFFIFLFSSLSARYLLGRNRLRGIMISEILEQNRFKVPVLGSAKNPIHGREMILSQLKNLASRGWSAIAVVGRRGVGKTRTLFEFLNTRDAKEGTVTVWVATPTKFEEIDFVESVLERVSVSVENAISRVLGSKPKEIRIMESNSAKKASLMYFFIFIFFLYLFIFLDEAYTKNISYTVWLTPLLFLTSSLVVFIYYITLLQPINLSSWLERNRLSNPHTVLLYREILKIQSFIENFRSPGFYQRKANKTAFYVSAALLVFVSYFFIYGIYAISIRSWNIDIVSSEIGVITILSGVAGIILIVIMTMRGTEQTPHYGKSLMTLISEYRSFLSHVVYRIQNDALGKYDTKDFEVLICIDELDKIVDPVDLRLFLTRMKVIFEIPGVYYYLSVSEDAMKTFYLGTSLGKDEVDSAFDHIVQIPPTTCDIGASIAKDYLEKKGQVSSPDTRMYRTIAAMSFGVPRDIIRQCDDLLVISREDVISVTPVDLVENYRLKQIELSFSSGSILKNELGSFKSEASDACIFIQNKLLLKPDEVFRSQTYLVIWVLCLMIIALKYDQPTWEDYSERLRDIGYRILDEKNNGLIQEIRIIHSKLLGDNDS